MKSLNYVLISLFACSLLSCKKEEPVSPELQKARDRMHQLASEPMIKQTGISTDEVVKALGIKLPLKPIGTKDKWFNTPDLNGANEEGNIEADFLGPADNLGWLRVYLDLSKSHTPSDEAAVNTGSTFLSHYVDADASKWMLDAINEFQKGSSEKYEANKIFGSKTINIQIRNREDNTVWICLTIGHSAGDGKLH